MHDGCQEDRRKAGNLQVDAGHLGLPWARFDELMQGLRDDEDSQNLGLRLGFGLLSLDDLAAKMSSDRLLGTVVRNVTAMAA